MGRSERFVLPPFTDPDAEAGEEEEALDVVEVRNRRMSLSKRDIAAIAVKAACDQVCEYCF